MGPTPQPAPRAAAGRKRQGGNRETEEPDRNQREVGKWEKTLVGTTGRTPQDGWAWGCRNRGRKRGCSCPPFLMVNLKAKMKGVF